MSENTSENLTPEPKPSLPAPGAAGRPNEPVPTTPQIAPEPHPSAPNPSGGPDLTDSRWEARITFLRSRAAVARAEVAAIESLHRDPEVLEDMLVNASADEVAMAEAVEHRISERVLAAKQVADAAEADYERAVLDGPDAAVDDTV